MVEQYVATSTTTRAYPETISRSLLSSASSFRSRALPSGRRGGRREPSTLRYIADTPGIRQHHSHTTTHARPSVPAIIRSSLASLTILGERPQGAGRAENGALLFYFFLFLLFFDPQQYREVPDPSPLPAKTFSPRQPAKHPRTSAGPSTTILSPKPAQPGPADQPR